MELLSEAVSAEILRYPAPSPASGLYGELLELRRLLPAELTRLEIARETRSISVDDFVRSSPCRETLLALLAK
jgi:hypothetical protein